MSDRAPRPRALSLVEIVLGALIIGISALPVLELIRAGTASVHLTGAEVVARGLAADILERICGRPIFAGPHVSPSMSGLLGAPVGWDVLVDSDPALAYRFPRSRLGPVLAGHEVKVKLQVESPYTHPALAGSTGIDLVRVTVSWLDAKDRPREVTLARLVDRR